MGFDRVRIARSYDEVAAVYAGAFVGELAAKPLDRALLGVLADDVRARRAGPIADLGAGPGHVGAFLANRGAEVVAVDLAPAMASIALVEHGLPAAAGSLTALPLASGSLGGAVAFYCLIHLDDDDLAGAAAELARVLRPGAPLLAAFQVGPPGESPRHVEEWRGHDVDLVFRRLDPATLAAVLEGAGLAVEATLVRAPYPEETDQRGYVLARNVRG
ncbi:MAG TPA: class I SAM-dependent methyltransferase [Acidimicrobiales bacterium]